MAGSGIPAVAILLVLGGTPAEVSAPKPFQKRLRVAAIDPAKSSISVREPDLEITWNGETRFLLHRSIPLKELKRGTPIHILGRLQTVRSTTSSESDSNMTGVAFLGMGDAYEHPPVMPPSSFVRWHAGILLPAGKTPYVKIGDVLHRVSVPADAAVYSLDKIKPELIAGKTIIVRGAAPPAGGDTKKNRATRILASEVHVVELNAEHQKVFQLQWGEVRKTPAGLRAEYFDNQNLTGLKLTRIDPNVNFDWGTGSPDPSIDGDSFSVRWTGQITPPATGTYSFQVSTDDGVRLSVDNQLLIDKWGSPTDETCTIELVAGKKYDLRMEYFEGLKTAFAKLSWWGPSVPRDIISPIYLTPAPAGPPRTP